MRFEGLPAVLERFADAYGARAAVALRPRPGEPPAVLAAHPAIVARKPLLARIGALLAKHPQVTAAGGCFRASLTLPGPGARPDEPGNGQGGSTAESRAADALVAFAEPAEGRPPCALVLIGDGAHWAAETEATALALAEAIAGQFRRASDVAELAEREAVTRAIIEASPDAVVIADAARRIVGFNPAAEELVGLRRADVLGEDMGSVLIPERNRARFMESTELFLRTGERGEYEGRLHLPVLRADGTERTVELTPLPLVVGGETYFCAFMRDVTELQRANAALAASEARFRLLSDLAPVGIARTDRRGVCSFVNERWCVLAGGAASDFTGRSWMDVLHPDDTGKVAHEWGRAQAQRGELRMDCRLRAGGGPQLWVHAAVTALPDGDDHPPGFLVALMNVSARKRAEQESLRLLAAERAARRSLADQTERLNSLIAAAIPGVLFADENAVIMQLNQSLCDMLGLGEPVSELVGGTVGDLMRRVEGVFADPAEVTEQAMRFRAARQKVADVRFACADGRTLECDYAPVFVDRHYRGDLWLLWDVSERAAREEQSERRLQAELASRRAAEQEQLRLAEQNARLREIDEFKTQFLATVSHELRGPLSSIVSYAELIRDDEQALSPDSAGFLDVVQRSAERLTQLVGDLLLLSRIDAGVIPLEPAPLDVAGLVADTVRAAAPAAAERGVALESSVRDGPPLPGDRLRLQQVFDNLVSNAIKFTPPGGTVSLTAACRDGEWRIDVADSGIGIPPDELQHLFERFFRASNARVAGVPGSGLGLSVVKAITQLHGGRVEAVSEPGAGTTFSVCLPGA
jgi:PAS domain S-box-containing protein